MRVIPITTTAVRVEWRPLSAAAWSGDAATGGYRVEYRPRSDFPSPTAGSMESTVMDIQVREGGEGEGEGKEGESRDGREG